MAAQQMQAVARARTNIALVKYWGKIDRALNIPAVGSISITLADLWSDTDVSFDPALPEDSLVLNGATDPAQAARVSGFLNLVRDAADVTHCARVVSRNNFPTGAGLASSASGFAALAVAATRALGLELDHRALSILARRGSGSAARSILGGFVEMRRGSATDGSDAFAHRLAGVEHWPLAVVIAITEHGHKAVGSTSGMERSAGSSPYYRQWVTTSEADLSAARRAIEVRDFDGLADVSEYSCLKMHGMAQAARPGLIYFNGATVDCLHAVRRLRCDGTAVFFTIDAGPQVKAVCLPEAVDSVRAALSEIPGVKQLLVTSLGRGVELLPT